MSNRCTCGNRVSAFNIMHKQTPAHVLGVRCRDFHKKYGKSHRGVWGLSRRLLSNTGLYETAVLSPNCYVFITKQARNAVVRVQSLLFGKGQRTPLKERLVTIAYIRAEAKLQPHSAATRAFKRALPKRLKANAVEQAMSQEPQELVTAI